MKKSTFICLIPLFCAMLLVYSPLLLEGKQLQFDDPVVVAPMAKVHSLADYLELKSKNLIYDVQPVRDFTFWILPTHVGNLLVWLIVSVAVVGCLLSLGLIAPWAYFLGAIFCLNPLFVSSVAWLSSRKHLLSAGFAIGMSWLVIRETDKERFNPSWLAAITIVVFYALAGFSHPMNLLWPIWGLTYVLFRQRNFSYKLPQFWFSVVAITGLGLSIAYLNFQYYAGAYLLNGSVDKYVSGEFDSFFWKFWAWGRMYFQMIFPLWTPGYGYKYQLHWSQ